MVVIQPQYVEKFQCDGKKCDAQCCRSAWQIDLTEETYAQWQAHIPEAAESLFWSEELGRYIVKGTTDVCRFLRADFLCDIQRVHGEAFLSPTCRTYPRAHVYFNGVLERTLSMTCPVARALAMGEADAMTLTVVELPDEMFHGVTACIKEAMDFPFLDTLIALQRESIDIFRTKGRGLPARIKAWISFLSEQELGFHLPRKAHFSPESYGKIMQEVLAEVRKEAEENLVDAGFSAELAMFDAWTDFPVRYQEAKLRHARFTKEQEQLLENFLIQLFLEGAYPQHVKGSLRKNAELFVLAWAFFDFLLLLKAARREEAFAREALLSYIEACDLFANHIPAFEQVLLSYLEREEQTLDFSRILDLER